MLDRCPKCGGLFALIGYTHLCRETPATSIQLQRKPGLDRGVVTPPVTAPKPIAPDKPVTAAVTCSRCAFLETEVKRLKRELADAGMKRTGMSGAERTRRYRERRRATGPLGP